MPSAVPTSELVPDIKDEFAPDKSSEEREIWAFSATPGNSVEEENTYFQLDDEFTVTNKEPELPQANQGMEPIQRDFDAERQKMEKQSEERRMRLNNLSNQSSSELQDFKEKLDVPAYKRRNIQLKDVPHSSEQNISKFNLNDDNEILGNNKFLHDNVD
jgi:cell division protein FtsZ